MNPLTIRAQNLRTFESFALDLPTGCTVIGGANGAGKSTILSAIDVALFAGRGELAPLLSLGEEELELVLEFEHAGELYRVRRGYRKGKASLDLERRRGDETTTFTIDGWAPLTRETAEATQRYLEDILGLSRATFRASSFLAQGDGAAFTEAQPRDRKAILAEILGLAVWDRLLEMARRELRQVEDAVLVARSEILRLEPVAVGAGRAGRELEAARVTLTASEGKLMAARAALEESQGKLAENDTAFARAEAAEAALGAARAEQERARVEYAAAVQSGVDREAKQAQLDEAAECAALIPGLEQELERARVWRSLVEQRDALRLEAERRDLARDRVAREAADLFEQSTALYAKADHLEQHIEEGATCDTCGQILGAESALLAAAHYRAAAAEAAAKAEEVAAAAEAERQAVAALVAQAKAVAVDETRQVRPVGNIEHELRFARNAETARATLAEQVRLLAEQNARQDELAIALADAAEKRTQAEQAFAALAELVKDESDLRSEVTHARRAVDVAESIVDACRDDVAKRKLELDQAKGAEVELAELRGSSAAQLRRLDLLKLAERAFGRDGIPALIVENAAIPQLELEANRILGELGGATGDCRIELRTQRALKSSSELRETLDIVILTPAGERAYETFSGGERTRLNLALRIALARLLAHRRGAESRLLAIDEPDGLDAAGMDALARILQGLAGDFDKVLVVSHQPQLATSFDQAIQVVKDGDRSRVDAGAPSEDFGQVAAA